MTTIQGLFAAGDASGASSHKFSSGSFTEGRIAAKAAISFCVDFPDIPSISPTAVEEIKAEIFKPLETYSRFKDYSIDPNINPNFVKPQMFMFRLQKIMDEYAGGVFNAFRISKPLLEKGLELFRFMREDVEKLAAEDTHELMRCWENIHRIWQAESHIRTILFREETRWPGYYFRTDFPKMKEEWKCFVNCGWNPETNDWEMMKKEIIDLVVLATGMTPAETEDLNFSYRQGKGLPLLKYNFPGFSFYLLSIRNQENRNICCWRPAGSF